MTSRDIPLLIKSASASSERRITPSWTIAQLKQKLEPVTGISPACQKLLLHLPDGQKIPLEADDEDNVQLARWDLIPYAEIEVCM
jgi:tubulin-folding cofactor B